MHVHVRRRYAFQILRAWINKFVNANSFFFFLVRCISASWWHLNYQSVQVQFHRQQVVNALRNCLPNPVAVTLEASAKCVAM